MKRKVSIPAVAYCRVSSDPQAHDDRDGLPRQRRSIEAFAKGRYRIVEWFEDDCSGTLAHDKRPAFARMLAYLLNDGVKHVLCESSDRWARDTVVSINARRTCSELGYTVITAKDGADITSNVPAVVLANNMHAVVAQFAKDDTVQRLRSAREAIRARGERCEGQPKFGTKPDEQDTLFLILKMQADGASLASIARELNGTGKFTRSGRPWTRANLWSVLKGAKGKL